MRYYHDQLPGILSFFPPGRQAVLIGAAVVTILLAPLRPFSAAGAFSFATLGAYQADATNTWTVTTNGDSTGSCSSNRCTTLRAAMTAAMDDTGDTIVFSIRSQTITLGSWLPSVTTTLTIDGMGQNVTISGNNSVGVFTIQSGGDLTLNHLTVANGFNNGGDGGGVDNENGILTIQNSAFANNSVTGAGSHGSGGGVFNIGTATIQNSTFSGNSANIGGGGGVFNYGTVTIQNSTFSGNSANGGGGVDNFGTLNLGSSIIAGNTGTFFPDMDNLLHGTINSLGHNLIGDGTHLGLTNGVNGDQVGTATSPINPQLNTLGSYGGPTQTMSLQANSPAIANGNCNLSLPAVPVSADQRGAVRKTPCDVGAFESGTSLPTTTPAITGYFSPSLSPLYAVEAKPKRANAPPLAPCNGEGLG